MTGEYAPAFVPQWPLLSTATTGAGTTVYPAAWPVQGLNWPDNHTATINLAPTHNNANNNIPSNNVTVKFYWNKPNCGVDGCYTTSSSTTIGPVWCVSDTSWTTNQWYSVNAGTTGVPLYGSVTNNNYQNYRRERLREIIRHRYKPSVYSNKLPMGVADDVREQRARATLRRLVGDRVYRSFLTSGFVSVRSPRSGKVYQIFPGHGITKVYQHGKMIERLCVVLSGGFPPTDSLIVRYLMILNNENDFRARAVQHSVVAQGARARVAVDVRPLPDLAKAYQLTG